MGSRPEGPGALLLSGGGRVRQRKKTQGPVAVIDIGSNSGRVMVYAHEVGGHLRVLAGSRASLPS